MRRYAETFFRYWFIALIPVIVLPAAMFAVVRHAPDTYLTTANIQVDQAPVGYDAQYESVAQDEADALNEFLQSPSNIFDVVSTAGLLNNGSDASTLVADIQKGMIVSARGPHLTNISYSGQNASQEAVIVRAFLTTTQLQQQAANSSLTQKNLSTLTYQLREGQKQQAQDYKALHDYMNQHGDTQSDLNPSNISDPTLASLSQQVQLDSQAIQDIQSKISAARATTALPPSLSQQAVFTVKDPPATIRTSSLRKKLVNVAIAAVVALLLAIIFLVTKTLTDRSLRYPDEVPAVLGLPVLAVVPYAPSSTTRRGRTPAVVPRGQLVDAK